MLIRSGIPASLGHCDIHIARSLKARLPGLVSARRGQCCVLTAKSDHRLGRLPTRARAGGALTADAMGGSVRLARAAALGLVVGAAAN